MTTQTKTLKRILKFIVPIIIEPDEEQFYAHSPALNGLMVDGKTREDALKNARDAATALLHSMLIDGDPIPLCLTANRTIEHSSLMSDDTYYSQEEIKVTI
jgi:predicted RNase H-like HicB family nuclease